jgi:hypothetical protein
VHGSPLLRAAIVLAVLLVLLLPLLSFTAPRARALPPSAAVTAATKAHLEIVSTKIPFTFAVTHLGKMIWQGGSTTESVAADVEMPIPKEGIDLAVQVDWSSAGAAAAKLTVTHGSESIERTLWGDGNAADVLTFP